MPYKLFRLSPGKTFILFSRLYYLISQKSVWFCRSFILKLNLIIFCWPSHFGFYSIFIKIKVNRSFYLLWYTWITSIPTKRFRFEFMFCSLIFSLMNIDCCEIIEFQSNMKSIFYHSFSCLNCSKLNFLLFLGIFDLWLFLCE
jgi:hypothetical protein